MESSIKILPPQSADKMNTRKSCFFIDDDEDDRDFFCTALHSVDDTIDCRFAKSGVDAITKLDSDASYVPDYIFIDLNMPLMDGAECLKNIRKMPRLSSVPVYIYSTAGSPKTVNEVMLDGATEFLIKPSSMSALAEMLGSIVAPKS